VFVSPACRDSFSRADFETAKKVAEADAAMHGILGEAYGDSVDRVGLFGIDHVRVEKPFCTASYAPRPLYESNQRLQFSDEDPCSLSKTRRSAEPTIVYFQPVPL